MDKILKIDRALLDQVSAQAKAAPRLRKNFNIHASETEPCNRLLNALEPGTYIQPHRHADPLKDEAMTMVRGKMGLVTFDENGKVAETILVQAGGEVMAVSIPHGVFHSLVALESGTVFFEAKAGPYQALLPAEKSTWAPAEGSPDAVAYLAGLHKLFGG